MSAVIQEDPSGKVKTVAGTVALAVTIPLGIMLLLRWVKGEGKKSKGKRTYFPTSEVTFKTISKKELGRKRITRPRNSF